MSGPVDATFRRPSISGATRRVRILTRLGDLADPKARRLCFYVERAVVLPAGAEVLLPSIGGRETFRFWHNDWSGHGCLSEVFPHLYALSTDPRGFGATGVARRLGPSFARCSVLPVGG